MRSHFSRPCAPVPRAKRAPAPPRPHSLQAGCVPGENFTRAGNPILMSGTKKGPRPRAHPQWKPHSLRMKLVERAVPPTVTLRRSSPCFRGSYPPQQPCLRHTAALPSWTPPHTTVFTRILSSHVLFRPSCWRMARTCSSAIGRCGGESQEAG